MFDFFNKGSKKRAEKDAKRSDEIAEAALALVNKHNLMEEDPFKGMVVGVLFSMGADLCDKGKRRKEMMDEVVRNTKESFEKNGDEVNNETVLFAIVTASLGYGWAEEHPKK